MVKGIVFEIFVSCFANIIEFVSGYDRNGNITTLQRYGRTGASTYGRIDYLTLTYSGNRLSTVKDTGSAAYGNDFRYSNTTSTTYSYTYDAAGRMTKDTAKGISSITWNVLGLPETVTFSSGVSMELSPRLLERAGPSRNGDIQQGPVHKGPRSGTID